MYTIGFFEIGNDWSWSVDIPQLPGTENTDNEPPMTEQELIGFVVLLRTAFGDDAVELKKDGVVIA